MVTSQTTVAINKVLGEKLILPNASSPFVLNELTLLWLVKISCVHTLSPRFQNNDRNLFKLFYDTTLEL